MGGYIKAVGLIIVLMFLVTFGVKNSHVVKVDYYFWFSNKSIPLYSLAFLSVVVGMIIGMIVGISGRLRMRKIIKDLKRKNNELKETLKTYDKEQKKNSEGEGAPQPCDQ